MALASVRLRVLQWKNLLIAMSYLWESVIQIQCAGKASWKRYHNHHQRFSSAGLDGRLSVAVKEGESSFPEGSVWSLV
jgi:hypothetical protein